MKYSALGSASLCFAASVLQAGEASADIAPHKPAPHLAAINSEKDGSYTARISTLDLDLASFEGALEMQRRVNRGIARLCWLRANDPNHKVGELISEDDCRRDAQMQAREQIARLTPSVRTSEHAANMAVDMTGS
jgi:UrcA family protein